MAYISPKKASSLSRSRVVANDIIIAKTGATIGKSGMFPDCYKSGIIASSCLKVTCDPSLVDPRFLAYLVASENGQRMIIDGSTGTTRSTINISPFSEIRFSIPDTLDEQRQIAAILIAIDNAIEQTKVLIAKHRRIKQGLMRDLLTRGVDENGELRPSYATSLGCYKLTQLGWIPKEWNIVKLSDLSQSITSGSRGWAKYYSEEGALFLRIGNLTREHINLRFDDIQRVKPPQDIEGRRTRVEVDDLLISITADLGIIGVVPKELEESYVNQHIALIRLKREETNPRWIGHFLAGNAGRRQFIQLNESGAKAGLNLPTVSSIYFPNPKKRERDRIVEILDNCDQIIESIKTLLSAN